MKIISPAVALLLLSIPAYSTVKLADALVSDVQQSCYETGTTDVWMSWAAADANIIQAWQDVYSVLANSGSSPANGTGEGISRGQVVYDAMRACYDQDGYAYPGTGLSHWMQGQEYVMPLDTSSFVIASPEKGTGGYYTGVYGTLDEDTQGLPENPCFTDIGGVSFSTSGENKVSNSGLKNVLDQAFSYKGYAGAIGIYTVNSQGQTLLHSLTCWGYETDDTGAVATLYVTDSYDETGLFKVSLSEYGQVRSEDGTHAFDKASYYLKSVTVLNPVEGAKAADTSLDGSTNICLTEAAKRSDGRGVDIAANRILATDTGASLTVQNAAGTGLRVQQEAYASLKGLSVSGSTGTGAVLDGRVDLSGGDLEISRNRGGMQVSGTARLDAGSVRVEGNATDGDGGGLCVIQGAALRLGGEAAPVVFTGNSAARGGAVANAGSLYVEDVNKVVFTGNSAAQGSAIYNIGYLNINNVWDRVSISSTGRSAGQESLVYNSGTMNLAWAGNGMEFTGATYGIDNDGVLYLGVDEGAETVFSGNALRSKGTMYIGMDEEGSLGFGSCGVVFRSGDVGPAALRTIEGEDGSAADCVVLKGASMDAASLVSVAGDSLLSGAVLSADGDFLIDGVGLSTVHVQVLDEDMAGTLSLKGLNLDGTCTLSAHVVDLESVSLFLGDEAMGDAEGQDMPMVDVSGIFQADRLIGSLTLQLADGMQAVALDFGDNVEVNLESLSVNGLAYTGMQGGIAYFRAGSVPEPATPALLAGAVALAALRRRRKR